jgi:prepilin-type N-terminal cleavage/methylation domain-containing protein
MNGIAKARRSSHRRCAGLTFFELMVVMIVVAVLAAIAVSPPMRGMLARQQVEGMHAELLTDLRLARSEALQRSGGSTSVAVTFGANADVSCYTIHVVVPGVVCDCTRAPGDICLPAAPGQELKSAQYPRAAGFSVAASGPSVVFEPPKGLATPDGLVIEVQGTPSGRLRTSLSALGVPRVCSPDGSIRGVASC